MTYNHLNLPPLPTLIETTKDGKRHYLLEDGTILPSVTTVLSYQPKPELDAWIKKVGKEKSDEIRNESAERGKILHAMIEDMLNNKNNYTKVAEIKKLPQNVWEMYCDLVPHIRKIDNIHYLETQLYSKKFGLAGRADIIAEYEGKLSIIDIKNARRRRNEDMILNYFLQTTAYAGLYEDMTGNVIDQIVILMAVENNEPQIWIKNPRDYVKNLVAAIKLYKAFTFLNDSIEDSLKTLLFQRNNPTYDPLHDWEWVQQAKANNILIDIET